MRAAKKKHAAGYSPSYPLQLFVFLDLLEQFIPDPRKHSFLYFFLSPEQEETTERDFHAIIWTSSR
jgi:hypothetical protein